MCCLLTVTIFPTKIITYMFINIHVAMPFKNQLNNRFISMLLNFCNSNFLSGFVVIFNFLMYSVSRTCKTHIAHKSKHLNFSQFRHLIDLIRLCSRSR